MKKMLLAGMVAVGVIALEGTLQVAHASPELFNKMEGKFRGKGLVKASAKGKKEAIRCRMRNKIILDGKKLDIGGSCAVSGFVFSLNGYIEQTGGNSYRASMFRSLANLKQSSFGGKRSGNGINFSFNATDRMSKKPVNASIKMNIKSENAFDVVINRTDPKTGKNFSVGTLNFEKR